ncbi:MAG: EcsC family protein [Myxococcaceae bacterium]|nr:EcsC family protein [Myxococcaceae bacterium]MCI0673221.1 EcsC family protein [Myxococcaceae bacterium]
MRLFDGLADSFRVLSPRSLRALAQARLADVVIAEVPRARQRVAALEKRFPSAGPRELTQHLIESKKMLAATVGGVSGAFGLLGLPADLVVMAYLQVVLLVEVATTYKVNLKGARARAELLDLLGYANGVGPMKRAGPKLFGTVAGRLLERGGAATLGRAIPLAAAPVTAYLNNRHIQEVGEQAVRFYEGLHKAEAKTRKSTAATGTHG